MSDLNPGCDLDPKLNQWKRSGIYRSAHKYKDAENPEAEPRHVTRVHPLVRTNAATGWKSLYVNQAMTVGIEGLDKKESDAILNHIYE